MKLKRSTGVATLATLVLILSGILFPAAAARNAAVDSSRPDTRYQTASGYTYAPDGSICRFGCSLAIRCDMESAPQVAQATFSKDYREPYHCFIVLTVRIYIPEKDASVTKKEVIGGDTVLIDVMNQISSETEYQGRTYVGEIVSATADFYIQNQMVQTLTVSTAGKEAVT